ncbi:MAG TPA: acyltransferase, partial [Kineosporiaceae bacterium]|nr:acyltransferase [Kineosporiaceae bacterium]
MVAAVGTAQTGRSRATTTSGVPEGRRPALTGLRAVAVVLVIGFHLAGDGLLAGGFLGVDVFFVLSGYLITGLLLADVRRFGGVRLGTFWLRRIRRLTPPLLLVGVVATLAVWRAGPVEGWPEQRLDLLWTLAYGANWHLLAVGAWSGGTPFLPPLAHAWSLAVEEQFYLAWPLVVAAGVLVARRLRRLGTLLPAGVAVAGGVLSVWWLATRYRPPNPVWALVATWGRIGELLAGALLALGWVAISRSLTGRSARWIGGAGWVGVLLAVATLR